MLEQEAKKLLAEAEQLRIKRAKLEMERIEAVGAVKSAVAELKSTYGVSSLEEATTLLDSMKAELQKDVSNLRSQLEEINGEESNSREA